MSIIKDFQRFSAELNTDFNKRNLAKLYMKKGFSRFYYCIAVSRAREYVNKAEEEIISSNFYYVVQVELYFFCLLLRRFDFSRKTGEAGELEARETGDEHARDHGKEKGERRNACDNSCRFLGNFVVFSSWYFSRVFKP